VHTLQYQAVQNEPRRSVEPQAAVIVSADSAARVEPQMGVGFKAAPEVSPLRALALIEGGAFAISLDRSDDFLASRPAQVRWTTRSRLAAIIPQAKDAPSLVLFARDARVAQLAAVDLSELLPGWNESGRIQVVEGGLEAWAAAGLPTVGTPDESLRQEDRIDFLFWAHDRRRGNKDAMRTYLDWEKQLLAQAQRDHSGFPLFRGRAASAATHFNTRENQQ
jgi:rhodanese-related sulfurtransferase